MQMALLKCCLQLLCRDLPIPVSVHRLKPLQRPEYQSSVQWTANGGPLTFRLLCDAWWATAFVPAGVLNPCGGPGERPFGSSFLFPVETHLGLLSHCWHANSLCTRWSAIYTTALRFWILQRFARSSRAGRFALTFPICNILCWRWLLSSCLGGGFVLVGMGRESSGLSQHSDPSSCPAAM